MGFVRDDDLRRRFRPRRQWKPKGRDGGGEPWGTWVAVRSPGNLHQGHTAGTVRDLVGREIGARSGCTLNGLPGCALG